LGHQREIEKEKTIDKKQAAGAADAVPAAYQSSNMAIPASARGLVFSLPLRPSFPWWF